MENSHIDFVEKYLADIARIADEIDKESICAMVAVLEDIRKNEGRLFVIGVGGGAGHASHAVNDFRKIAGIESYTPTDNVSELTARINDDGWEKTFTSWLEESRLSENDGVLVFSVGGGSIEKKISLNIVSALQMAKSRGAKIMGIVGRDGGYTRKVADACVIIPNIDPENVTSHTESFQAVIWHLLVSHPVIRIKEMKWESLH